MSENILDKIVAATRGRVAKEKEVTPLKRLEQSVHFSAPTVSLRKYLARPDLSGIIAEIKRRSPSKGSINPYIKVSELSLGYMQAGAAALSVLTEPQFFGGALEDLTSARRYNFCPILRKDFIIDEYQLYEARSFGADVILLIAACLSPQLVRELGKVAHDLGLEVLLEIHNEQELECVCDEVDLVGVNNRDLRDFSVDVNRSFELRSLLPAGVVAISESGLREPETVAKLRRAGFSGFLIGEQFMAHADPAAACRSFVASLNRIESRE